jgi:hypothetical protein
VLTFGNEEARRTAREHALTRIQHYVLGCAKSFEASALQYQFDQAEQQLSLLRMLTSRFSNVNLQVDLAALASLLTQCKETKAEE